MTHILTIRDIPRLPDWNTVAVTPVVGRDFRRSACQDFLARFFAPRESTRVTRGGSAIQISARCTWVSLYRNFTAAVEGLAKCLAGKRERSVTRVIFIRCETIIEQRSRSGEERGRSSSDGDNRESRERTSEVCHFTRRWRELHKIQFKVPTAATEQLLTSETESSAVVKCLRGTRRKTFRVSAPVSFALH